MIQVNKILFPCDLTENSSMILPYVLSVSEKYDAQIYLLHVIKDLSEWGGLYALRRHHPSVDVLQKEALEAAERGMNRLCEEQLQSCPNFQKRIVSGHPAEEILKAVESEAMDMVIMATHGRRGLDHTIMGSVAENVIKGSSVPVLVINPYKLK